MFAWFAWALTTKMLNNREVEPEDVLILAAIIIDYIITFSVIAWLLKGG